MRSRIFTTAMPNGIEISDLVQVRAPQPTAIVAVSRDFFSIQGAHEVYRESMRAFRAFGLPGNLELFEDDNIHTSTPRNREAVYGFFQRIFIFPGSSADEKVALLEPEELYVTETGQVSNSLGGGIGFQYK